MTLCSKRSRPVISVKSELLEFADDFTRLGLAQRQFGKLSMWECYVQPGWHLYIFRQEKKSNRDRTVWSVYLDWAAHPLTVYRRESHDYRSIMDLARRMIRDCESQGVDEYNPYAHVDEPCHYE